ncbi:Tify [Macleaya cordata]|uniref:Protein TIFY n=1 Tax=Macleaya cordata TaxID=56857 RepID=A0A200PME3_MACCD|nr:Tify [Macleaya cordata]
MKKTTVPLSMRRNCNLDLCLLPPSSSSIPSSDSYSTDQSMIEGSDESPQQLTIFFDGRICVCDVTELQARAILSLARREMDERMKTPRSLDPASPVLQSQLHSPNNGISMKRSLQRFLQKRKNRIQATSHPYNNQQ